MPDNVKISELTPALQIADNAIFPHSQDNGGSNTTFGAPMTQIGAKVNEGLTFTNLNTSLKTIVGAINSLLTNMTTAYADLTYPVTKGTCCSYAGLIYQANQNILTTEAWTPAHWTQVKITDVVSSGGGGASSLDDLSDVTLDTVSLASGQVIMFTGTYFTNSTLWTDLTGTLTTGSTSITISSNKITTTSTIQVFTDLGVDYNSITVATGSVTLTFDAQASDMGVKVRVS